MANYGWFDYLKESMEATNEEIDYLILLHGLKSKQRVSGIKNETDDFPSMIIDDFLYHGELAHARNIELLRKLDIRHIITVCDFKLKKEIFNNFNVLWIDLHDIPLADISQYFDQTNEFLNACKSKNEKVLVHCQMGVSRSSSIVLAYLLK
jgi:protein-tyrosine phosphatase